MKKKQKEKIFNSLKKNAKGITLIALVVTIIVLLILAGVAIMLTVGENGLFKRAENATKEYDMASVKEELVLMLGNMEIDNAFTGISKEDIAKELEKNGATINDVTDDEMEGEYKDYEFTIDEDNNVIIGGKLTGAKPTVRFENTPDTPDVDEVQIKVIAETTEGEISSIEPINGAVLLSEESNSSKTYVVKQNGTYKFKVIGSNGRRVTAETNITNIAFKEESLLSAISNINNTGVVEVRVLGKTQTQEEIEKYSLNVIDVKGDLVLGEKLLLNGEEATINDIQHSGNTYTVGNVNDVAKSGVYATNTVVLKVEGNLTIENNITLTAIASAGGYGGPKGLIIYCTENITNNGTISMTARGAYAKGQNVYLWKNAGDSTYEYIPKVGAAGGAGVSGVSAGRAGNNANTITETCRATRRRSFRSI